MGVRKVSNVSNRSRTVTIEVCLKFKLCFSSKHMFPFQVYMGQKLVGNFLTNRFDLAFLDNILEA
jgi:hypothetical protein